MENKYIFLLVLSIALILLGVISYHSNHKNPITVYVGSIHYVVIDGTVVNYTQDSINYSNGQTHLLSDSIYMDTGRSEWFNFGGEDSAILDHSRIPDSCGTTDASGDTIYFNVKPTIHFINDSFREKKGDLHHHLK